MLLEARSDCWDYYLFCEKGFQTLKLNRMLTSCSILSSSQITILVSWNISGFILDQTVCYRILSLCRRDLVYFYGQESTSLYWSTYRLVYTFTCFHLWWQFSLCFVEILSHKNTNIKKIYNSIKLINDFINSVSQQVQFINCAYLCALFLLNASSLEFKLWWKSGWLMWISQFIHVQ